MAKIENRTMKGDWCQTTWDSYSLNTLVRFDGEKYFKMSNGHVAHIFDNSVHIFHDWDNALGYDESLRFYTVKIVPRAMDFQGETRDKMFSPTTRHDKQGYTSKSTLKDIIAYLNNDYAGEVAIEDKHGLARITLYMD
jgi:hypothetical protein